ncbi:MAG: HEAT repeat domain-containing protein, partial [Verrucomicrobiota bacterium]
DNWRTNRSIEQIQAAEAIRHIGTNALPFLLPEATRKESGFDGLLVAIFGSKEREQEDRKRRLSRAWNAALALYALGPAAKSSLPQLKQAYFDYDNEGTARNAAVALAGMGPEGWKVLSETITNTNWFACFGIWALASQHATVPGTVDSLIQLFTNNVVFHSSVAAWALGELGEEPDRVVPVMLNIYQSSTNYSVKADIAHGLAKFGSKAHVAVPALLKALHDPDVVVRFSATNALRAIDPEAATKAESD